MRSALLLALLTALSLPALADDAPSAKIKDMAVIVNFLNGLKSDNSVFMDTHKIEFFAELSKGQSPTATLITCSDSRVQTTMFDRSPEGDLFTIRNIGNQLVTAEGSVEYGVQHLHSPLLIFLGHSRCGAIAAASSNYSKESPAIKRELDTINIPKEIVNLEGVKLNVNNQVAAAMTKFAEEMAAGELVIVGAVMDFADDLHRGAGKLHLININGETDPAKLEDLNALLNKAKTSAATGSKNKAASPSAPAKAESSHNHH